MVTSCNERVVGNLNVDSVNVKKSDGAKRFEKFVVGVQGK